MGVGVAPRLGHDRDEPDRHASAALKPPILPKLYRRRAARRPADAGLPAVRRRDEDHRRLPARNCRGTARRFGRLKVAGPAVAKAYFTVDTAISSTTKGFFDTGDVATIDPHGYMQITDRSKDVIKSGGEWISSIDLENLAVGPSAVARSRRDRRLSSEMGRAAAADRRSSSKGQSATREDGSSKFMDGKMANGGCPTTSPSVDGIPHTAHRQDH